jgi:kynurenine formamidase
MDPRELGAKLRNWGRWGPEDELGTVNFVTPAKLVEAGTMIRTGKIISMALALDNTGPQLGGGRFNPIHTMRVDGGDDALGVLKTPNDVRYADDLIFMALQCSTQWDALSHVWYDGQLYNGFPAGTVTSGGAARNGIGKLYRGVVSRGVLLDIPRAKGIPYLDKGYEVTPEDLEEAERKQGVRATGGDVLVVKVGAITRWRAEKDIHALHVDSAGIGMECLPWLHAREVAALCVDNTAVEVRRPEQPQTNMPFHMVAIRDMGLLLGELFDLDDLSEDCAADGVYEFLFSCPPLRIPRAVGSPINPLAVK